MQVHESPWGTCKPMLRNTVQRFNITCIGHQLHISMPRPTSLQVRFPDHPVWSFVGRGHIWRSLCPLHYEKERGKKKEKGRSFTSICRCYTHTPGRSQVNPERQEEEKSGHRRRAKGQNSAGGGGNERTSRTNLRGETDLTKTEHTT